MNIRAFLLPLLLLSLTLPRNDALAAGNRTILVPGEPPLQQNAADDIAQFMQSIFGKSFSAREKAAFQQILVDTWRRNDSKEMEFWALNILAAKIQLDAGGGIQALSPQTAQRMRDATRQDIGNNVRDSARVLALLAPGNPSMGGSAGRPLNQPFADTGQVQPNWQQQPDSSGAPQQGLLGGQMSKPLPGGMPQSGGLSQMPGFAGQSVFGTYGIGNATGQLMLQLVDAGNGRITGQMLTVTTAGQAVCTVQATMQQTMVVGTCVNAQEAMYISAAPQGAQLTLGLAPPNMMGQPDLTQFQQMVLNRTGGAVGMGMPPMLQGGAAGNPSAYQQMPGNPRLNMQNAGPQWGGESPADAVDSVDWINDR